MIKKIKTYEEKARLLEPSIEKRTLWQKKVEQYAFNFLDKIDNTKAFVQTETKGKDLLNYPFSNAPISIEKALSILDKNVDTLGLNPASGGHLGYIPGGGIFPTALGDYLAAVTNRYAGIFFGGPGAVRVENMLIRWMCSIMGYPSDAFGNLASGGSIGNLTAIVTARDFKKITPQNIPNSVIYLTDQVHHCVQKAIRIAGLQQAQTTYIPVDDQFKMDTNFLRQQIKKDKQAGKNPFLLIGSAGTTNVGAIDPLDTLADLAEEFNLWFHVDAAYGGFFILTEEGKAKLKGIERSDSVVIDPHKGLFLSYGLGAVLIKNVKALQDAHQYQASYMQDAQRGIDEPSPADLSPELTKHFRGLRLWLPLQLYGLAPFKAALTEKLMLTQYFYHEIQTLGFEVGPFPELSVMIYRYVPQNGDANDFNARLTQFVHADGRVFLSSTTIDGVFWIRIAILAFRTHLNTIDLCLEVLKKGV
ncbi:MAG TPA: aminotransferase class I/II-fold pyridoxal phosphate-dependent enzyme, partial [Saprospiraceae bacterium]|nr:aminotransferase class I/II-fold pyridoxal phosphate-dependent enzyme [Saprospiraceae bacterium]